MQARDGKIRSYWIQSEKKPESSPAGRRPEGIPAALRDHANKDMTLKWARGCLRRTQCAKIVAKLAAFAAELQVGMRTYTQICPTPVSENAAQCATRAKLRAKNRRDVV